MSIYTLEDLEQWNDRIVALVERFGLDPYPQEFEVCDHNDMLSYMVYSGMPSHYPHWSYGKNFEKLKTLYDYGVSGLPYEMVINSNPSIAYLMRDNSLALQVLTMAHVYAHNDFFKNNRTFHATTAGLTIETFKAHATRVRHYVEDPSIGLEKVERILDAAHALSFQCRRNFGIKKENRDEQKKRKIDESRASYDPFRFIHRRAETTEPDLQKVPLYPEDDILLFIRDHNPMLSEWERDLLTMVHEETQYFIPQIETKIMNEGWASFWHKKILEELDLPQDLHLEFIVRHTQVLRPAPGSLNPYYVGMKVWEDIFGRYGRAKKRELSEDDKESYRRKGWDLDNLPLGLGHVSGDDKIFRVREADRDISFLRNYLTEELIREMKLFEYKARGSDTVVTRIASEDDWRAIKETLLKGVGMGTIPVIKVEDSDYKNSRTLFLNHYHDGERDLQLEYAEKTLKYVSTLWGRDVVMATVIDKAKTNLSFSVADDKLVIQKAA